MTELSVLIVNYNSWRVCVDAVRSLLEHAPRRADGTRMPFEVIVVDNASPERDPSAEADLDELLARATGQLIMHDENGGYSKGMNLALRYASGDQILVSNPDVIFQAGCIDALLRYSEEHSDAGAVAPVGYWDLGLDGHLPPNILPTLRDMLGTTLAGISRRAVARYSRKRTRAAVEVWDARGPVDLDMLSGCCFLMRRAVIEKVGFFDDRYPLYYEDTDLSMRLRKAGMRVVQVPDAQLVHLYNRSGQTAGAEAMSRYWVSRRRYYRKWYGPVGAWLFDFSKWFLASALGRKLSARTPQPHLHVLPTSPDKPRIEFGRELPRFVVEISLDPRFYLAAGTFGAGDHWSPSDSLFANFGPTVYFFRVCEIGQDGPREVGVYRFERTVPAEWVSAAPVETGHECP